MRRAGWLELSAAAGDAQCRADDCVGTPATIAVECTRDELSLGLPTAEVEVTSPQASVQAQSIHL